MNSRIIILVACMSATMARAQQLDTIVTTDKRLQVRVREVTPTQIAYLLPNSDVTYRINRSEVVRIGYSDGRTEASPLVQLPVVRGPEDWEKVMIIEDAEKLQGVYKISDINVSATRVDWFRSNRFKLKQRARNELKMIASMLGGNVVYLTAQTSGVLGSSTYLYPVSNGHRNYGYYGRTSSYGTAESMNGAVFTTSKIDTAAFRKFVAQHPFSVFTEIKMRYINGSFSNSDFTFQTFSINKFTIENNQIIVHQKLKGVPVTDLRVNYFDEDRIVLSYQNGVNYYVIAARPIGL